MRGGTPERPPREVELWRANKLVELGRGGLVGFKAEHVTINEIAAMLLTRYEAEGRASVANARNRLKYVTDALGIWRANDLKADRILDYAVKRKAQGAAVATVNLELRLLSRAYAVAIAAGRLNTAPRVPHLPNANIRRSHVPDAILDKIRAELPADMADAVWFLRLTGWRLQEGLRLEWRRVDFEEQIIRLDTSKTGEPRVLSFRHYADLRELLERRRPAGLHPVANACEHPTGGASTGFSSPVVVPGPPHGAPVHAPPVSTIHRITPYVFPGPSGTRPLSEKTLRYHWKKAAAKAGMPGAMFHDLRRSMVRAMDRAGVPRSVAMSITGHKSEAVYRQYGLFDASMQDAALASLKPDSTIVPFEKKG